MFYIKKMCSSLLREENDIAKQDSLRQSMSLGRTGHCNRGDAHDMVTEQPDVMAEKTKCDLGEFTRVKMHQMMPNQDNKQQTPESGE